MIDIKNMIRKYGLLFVFVMAVVMMTTINLGYELMYTHPSGNLNLLGTFLGPLLIAIVIGDWIKLKGDMNEIQKR